MHQPVVPTVGWEQCRGAAERAVLRGPEGEAVLGRLDQRLLG